MSIVELHDIDTEAASPLILDAAEDTLQDYEARLNGISAEARLAVTTLIRHARNDLKVKMVPHAVIEQIQSYYNA